MPKRRKLSTLSQTDPSWMVHATPFPDRPWTVCFYSYRGGVGRTTAMLNTAISLTRMLQPIRAAQIEAGELRGGAAPSSPPSVFLLDFDLEAPGIDEFETFRPPSEDQKGLVEYLAEYREKEVPPPLAEFVYSVPVKIGGKADDRYKLWVMRAGRKDDAYVRQLAKLDLTQLYRFEYGQHLFENLRAGVQREFGCTMMLVDSRTGLTDIGGVCLGHLADAVALVFQPTSAQIAGLRHVVSSIVAREKREKRSIPRLYIASKVREIHDGELDSNEREQSMSIVQACEGDATPHDLTDVGDRRTLRMREVLFDGGELEKCDTDRPNFAVVELRENVKYRQLPDSYLVKADENTTAVGGYCLARWCLGARSADERKSRARTNGADHWKPLVSKIKRLSTDSLRQLLQNEENVTELSGVPVDLWDTLPARKQAMIYKALRPAAPKSPNSKSENGETT
ncbi:MAG: hypothetical protein HZB38_02535 [Planctomycetes bacterium]|nr:hypothetical protein [Planctomycetota bacterium]